MGQTPPPPPRQVLHWDLARSHRIEAVGWRDRAQDFQFWRAPLELTLELPGGRTLHGVLADARAQRTGDEVYVLVLRGLPQTLDEAAAEAGRRSEELGLPRQDLDRWREDARSGDFKKDRAFATRRNDLTPALSLEVRHTYDEERPWYLAWEITWLVAAQPAPPPR